MLPTAAYTPATSSCSTHSMAAALQTYLHACFNARTSATVFLALQSATATFIADRYHAWAPLRCCSDSLRELVATLELLDAAPCAVRLSPQDAPRSCDRSMLPVQASTRVQDEEPHACTDADTGQQGNSFDIIMHEDSQSGGHSQPGSQDSAQTTGVACMAHKSAAAPAQDGGHMGSQLGSPPAMQPFGSFCHVHTADAPICPSPVRAEPIESAVDSVHAEYASVQTLIEPSRAESPILPASAITDSRNMHAQHATIDAAHLQPPTRETEPGLPCSSSSGTFQDTFLPGVSLRSSFSSPRKHSSSHDCLARQQVDAAASSQDVSPRTSHACLESMVPAATSLSPCSRGHLPWNSSPGISSHHPYHWQLAKFSCELFSAAQAGCQQRNQADPMHMHLLLS